MDRPIYTILSCIALGQEAFTGKSVMAVLVQPRTALAYHNICNCESLLQCPVAEGHAGNINRQLLTTPSNFVSRQ